MNACFVRYFLEFKIAMLILTNNISIFNFKKELEVFQIDPKSLYSQPVQLHIQ